MSRPSLLPCQLPRLILALVLVMAWSTPGHAGKGGKGQGGGDGILNQWVCGPPPAQVLILIDSGRIAQDAAVTSAPPSVVHRECHCRLSVIQLGSSTCSCSPSDPAEWMECTPPQSPVTASCSRTFCKDDGLVVTGCSRDGGSVGNPKFKLGLAAQVSSPYGPATADVYLGYMESTSLVQQSLDDQPVGAASLPKQFPMTVPLTYGYPRSFQLTAASVLAMGIQPQGVIDDGETENPSLYLVRAGGGQQARYSVFRADDGNPGEFVLECTP